MSTTLNRCLRHDQSLPVDTSGFAYAGGLIYVLSALRYKLRTTPTTSDLLYVVATQEEGRLQAACLTGSLEPYDVLRRSIQGHGGNIDKQMNPERAHTQV